MARFQVGDIIKYYNHDVYFLILKIKSQKDDRFYYDTYCFGSGFISLDTAISEVENVSNFKNCQLFELFKI